MSELRSSGELKVRTDGTTCLRASVHLDGGMWIRCCTYPDRAPVLAIDSGPVEVSVGARDFAHVVRPGESGGCHVCEPLLSLPVFSASE